MANTKTESKKAEAAVSEAVPEKKVRPKKVNLPEYVVVKNGFHGTLVYVSRRTGEVYTWDGYGTEQELELRDLRDAKNSSRDFYINNWFMFDDEWVLDYLGVRQYYNGVIRIEDFDAIFDKEPDELKKFIGGMSQGQKMSVLYRASEMIASGEIDSRRKIAALEEALGVELIER